MRLAGKVAVVTGAAVGLGRAVAARFAREGAAVVVADKNEKDGAALCGGTEREGHDVIFAKTDVSQESEVNALFDTALSQYGRLDVLHNNAAVLLPDRDRPVNELSIETWDYVMGVNSRGPSCAPGGRWRRCCRTVADPSSFSALPPGWLDAPPH